MNKVIGDLYNEMGRQLEAIALSAENPLQLSERSYQVVESTLQQLKQILVGNGFANEADEIDFFRNIKPMFQKELFYFQEVFQLEAWKPPVGRQEQISHYLIGAKRVDLYFKMHNELYTYYRTDNHSHDTSYFLRGRTESSLTEPVSASDLDSCFSTLYSIQLSKLQAYEKFSNYLYQCIYRLENPASEISPADKSGPRLVWTDRKTSLIELAYAIFCRKSVNFGRTPIRDIITALETVFNVQAGNYHRTFQSMRIRKEQTPYLDAARENLIRYMRGADNDTVI